jgi:hypothetical protein
MKPLPIIESYPIPDAFADALARIETVGPCIRLVFTVTQSGVYDYDEDQPPKAERVVVTKLVIPAELRTTVARQLLNESPTSLSTDSGSCVRSSIN